MKFACAIALLVITALALFQSDLGKFGRTDFSQYWSSSKLLIQGENPYDRDNLAQIQRSIGNKELILIWNPPIIFPIILPFALFSFSLGVKLWLIVSGILYVLSLHLIFRFSLGDLNWRKWLLFGATFYPIVLSLSYGQSSPIMLIGLCGFLYLLHEKSDARRNFLAGGLLALTLIKYHVLYLLYLHLAVSFRGAFAKNFWLGFFGFGALLWALPHILYPDLSANYFAAISSPPIYWATANIGSFLQEYSNLHTLTVRLIPTIITALVCLPIFLRKPWMENFYWVIPLSLLTAPYGWVYDQMLLLPVAAYLLSSGNKITTLVLFVANALMFINVPIQYGIWVPCLYLALATAPSAAHRH